MHLFLLQFYSFCLSKDQILEEHQRQYPSIQTFPVQFGKKHAQPTDVNRPGSACSIGRSLSQQFGGSSSTVNELCLGPSSNVGTPLSMTSNRRIFASDTDVRAANGNGSAANRSASSSTTPISSNLNGTLPRSNSNSHHQVTYTPQLSSTSSRPLSVHPQPISSPSYLPEPSSRTSNTHHHHHHTSSTSLNSTNPLLTIKSIDPISKGTYRVLFSDNSTMLLRADCTDGQLFVDQQGKRYTFDRRQPHQPDPIQERLALMQQDHHAFSESTNSQGPMSSQQQ